MFAKLASNLMGTALPFTMGEAHGGGGWAGWAHHAGTARDGGAPVSVWRLACARKEDPRLHAARHGVQKLKTVSVWLVAAGRRRRAWPACAGPRALSLVSHRPARAVFFFFDAAHPFFSLPLSHTRPYTHRSATPTSCSSGTPPKWRSAARRCEAGGGRGAREESVFP